MSFKRQLSQIDKAALSIVAEALKAGRLEKRLTAVAVAKRLGISPPHLADCENGRRYFSDKHIAAYRRLLK